MRKLIFIIFIVFVSIQVKADQLEYLTRDQAVKATELLREQENIVLWCGCCEGNIPKRVVSLTNVYYSHSGYEESYKITIEGTDQNGNNIREVIDLAYVHIIQGSRAYCVGKTLNFDCDPCTGPFLFD